MTSTQTAADLIAQSIQQTEIVTAPYTSELATDLLIECEDNVETEDATEYWGTDDAGNLWRVHLTVAE